MLGVVLATAMSASVPAGEAASAPITIVGPQAAKAVCQALAEGFASQSGGEGNVLYHSSPSIGTAAASLAGGRDLMLTLGPLSETDTRRMQSQWKQDVPTEQAIAARAAAIVIHPNNPLEALSLDQLRSIYTGKVTNWRVLGGGDRPIRRYALTPADPLTRLFDEGVMAGRPYAIVLRKRDSSSLLTAISSDPQAIGFMDASMAAASGDTASIVGIGDRRSSVLPNAQTIKEKAYPLAGTLTLYVAPHASLPAKAFVKYILSGKGDAILRDHGYMPTLRAVRADTRGVLAAFASLYGPDIQRVRGTSDTEDDVALAGQIVDAARAMAAVEPELLTAMCEAAYDLAYAAGASIARDKSSGTADAVAFAAMALLSQQVPDRAFDGMLKRAALIERAFGADEIRSDGEYLVEVLMEAADRGTALHRFDDAQVAWQRAQRTAEQINSPRLPAIQDRMAGFAARSDAIREAESLDAKLRAAPDDPVLRQRMLRLQLMELDNPTAAMRYLDAADSEAMKTNIPLAAAPLSDATAEAALRLAEWYAGLVGQAGVGGRELMEARARACYERFFTLHKPSHDGSDILVMRATLGLQKVGGKTPNAAAQAPQPAAKPSHGGRGQPAIPRLALKPGELITDIRLAEFIGDHPTLQRLTSAQIGSAARITDLGALARLPHLDTLDLRSVTAVKEIAPVTRVTTLTRLTLTELPVKEFSSLKALSRLAHLNLSGAAHLTDLSFLRFLPRIKSLDLSRCAGVTDLSPLSEAGELTDLNLSGCRNLHVVTCLGELASTLKSLNVRGCAKLEADEKALRQMLPRTRVMR